MHACMHWRHTYLYAVLVGDDEMCRVEMPIRRCHLDQLVEGEVEVDLWMYVCMHAHACIFGCVRR